MQNEFKVVFHSDVLSVRELNGYGADRWRLCSVVKGGEMGGDYIHVFERPVVVPSVFTVEPGSPKEKEVTYDDGQILWKDFRQAV